MAIQSSEELLQKKCVPCEGGVPKLTPEEAADQISEIDGWSIVHDGERIRKDWKVSNFVSGMNFLNQVMDVAEDEGHHPDVHLWGYRNVYIEIWTHAIGGLSENDFILAAKIDKIPID